MQCDIQVLLGTLYCMNSKPSHVFIFMFNRTEELMIFPNVRRREAAFSITTAELDEPKTHDMIRAGMGTALSQWLTSPCHGNGFTTLVVLREAMMDAAYDNFS